MLIAASPYCPKKDLGGAYNDFMLRLRSDDWAALIDHDAMWTTKGWHGQVLEAIEREPETGLFTCVTNRIGCGWQKARSVDPRNHNVAYHREFGRRLAEIHGSRTDDVTEWEKQPSGRPLSGVVMVVSKRSWEAVGGFKNGFLTVDNDMHARMRRKGLTVRLLLGVYVYHWYRAEGKDS